MPIAEPRVRTTILIPFMVELAGNLSKNCSHRGTATLWNVNEVEVVSSLLFFLVDVRDFLRKRSLGTRLHDDCHSASRALIGSTGFRAIQAIMGL